MRDYKELLERLHKRIALTTAGSPLQDDLEETADAIEELVSNADKFKWISVEERLPEESEGLNLHEDMVIHFVSVWCCDVNTGTISVRNRFQHKITGIQFLDQDIQDTDWHWSESWWEPTHWMPIVPLPEPPKEETND